jgi:hypothetical protein
MKPSAGLPGVEGVLVVISSPVPSSSATTSVNSPGVDADPDPSGRWWWCLGWGVGSEHARSSVV